MISISSIRTYMYCPLKLYFQIEMDEKTNNEFLLNKTMKELRIDLQDLFQRNLRRLKKDMEIAEIEKHLSKNIDDYIKNSIAILENNDLNCDNLLNQEIKTDQHLENIEISNISEIDKLNDLALEIKNEAYFNMKILALKSQKAMKLNEKDGNQIAEMFFPTSMYSYLIKDHQLEIIGTCDKIEIVEGKYFPINIKNSNPPIKGVWDSDAIELVANALLIEQEFDTEVFVGFIDYLKIGDRRPVVMDANLRKGLFKVLNEVQDIINEKIAPNVSVNIQKCNSCDYKDICYQEADFQ
ncbi:MAG: CRISPR-associated protein Cas4 [Methanobrevibacter sp.]|nr:CRISPR-associated protein Cas4 [Methanobrevibacter sp.]